MKSSCRAPWISLSIRNNNYISVCANSGYSVKVERKMKLSEALNLPQMQSYRAGHHQAEPLATCRICTSRGALGLHTLRDYNNDLVIPKTFNLTDSSLKPEQILHLDLNLSNVCNLKCRMCSFERSSGWRDDQSALAEHLGYIQAPVAQEEPLLEIDFEAFRNLHIFVVKGGEPLFDKKTLALLYRFVETGRAQKMNLTIFTNGVFVKKHLAMLSEFGILNLNFSFEGTGNLYSYIRGGTHTFEEFADNVRAAAGYKNIRTAFMYTPQAYNVFDFADAADFVWNRINPLLSHALSVNALQRNFGNILEEPAYLAISVLPAAVRQQALARLQKSPISQLPIWAGLENLLRQEQNLPNYEKFLSFTKTLDGIRKQNLLSVVPELAGSALERDLC